MANATGLLQELASSTLVPAWAYGELGQSEIQHGMGNLRAWLRFNDPGMFFENDYESGGIIRMHLPSTMFQNVLDVLRNEKPVYIYFVQNRAFLGTAKEPIGEGEK